MIPAPASAVLPPFVLRARVLTPLVAGGTLFLDDGIVEVDATGLIARVGAWADPGADVGPGAPPTVDLRPWVVMPGLVDLHAHIPQLPNAGVGGGLDLLDWLERYTLPLERRWDGATTDRLAPAAFGALAAAGTTTVVAYGTADPASTDALFRAAETHGMRALMGLVLMGDLAAREDGRYPADDAALAASDDLCSRWDGRDRGRLRYAFTPRFAVCCDAHLLSESARLARSRRTYWQTHLSEDPRELAQVARRFPDAADYLDVYDRAGALGPRSIFAHAIHLSDREVDRLAASGAAVAHCPASNLFLPSGIMPLARYLEAGIPVGLGSDVSGGPSLSMFEVMRVGAYAQHARRALLGEARQQLDPLGWLRLGTLGGASALGLGDVIGSIEAGKEADLVAVDPTLVEPMPGAARDDGAAELASRLIFRTHPEMVRAAWVRGTLLPAGTPRSGRTAPHGAAAGG